METADLGFTKFGPIRIQIEDDAFLRSIQRHATDEENEENDEREGRCEVHHLRVID